MGFIDNVKDAVSVVQKADNIELYRQLLDIYKEALEMQDEIVRLKEENKALQKQKDISENVERYPNTYVTLKDDSDKLIYCATCWDNEKNLVQLRNYNDRYNCNKCSNFIDEYDVKTGG